MDILKLFTKKSLSLNKRRTVSTILGIMLSVALICAVATMVSSFKESMIDYAKKSDGNWHFIVNNSKPATREKLKLNRQIKKIFTADTIGYASLLGADDKSNQNIKLANMNKDAFDEMRFVIKKGRFPKNSNEIIVSDKIIAMSSANYKIGDNIKFDFYNGLYEADKLSGEEISAFENEEFDYGEYKNIRSKTISDDEVKKLNNHNFKIVGIMERPGYDFEPYSYISSAVITTKMDKEFKPYIYRTYMQLKNPSESNKFSKKVFGDGYLKLQEKGVDIQVNETLIKYEGEDFSAETLKSLYSIAIIIIVVILLSSIFCIKNSFSIAITEKIKQYGVLASVGATKSQIRKNVLYEALYLARFGIALGVLLGIFADYVVIQIVNRILSKIMVGEELLIKFCPSLRAAIIAVILGIVTVIISALSSARKASKISPIESIRGSADIKINKKKLKTPRWIEKLFGIGGVIAYKNLVRSRKKYRTTVISIVVSIVIFIVITSLIENLFKVQSMYYLDTDYNLSVSSSALSDEKNIDRILKDQKYDFAAIRSSVSGFTREEDKKAYNENQDQNKEKTIGDIAVREKNIFNKKYADDLGGAEYITIAAYDKEAFKYMAKHAGFDYNDVKGGAILFDRVTIFDSDENKYKIIRKYNYKNGDKLKGRVAGIDTEFEVFVMPEDVTPVGYENSTQSLLIIDKDMHREYNYCAEVVFINSEKPYLLEENIKKMDAFSDDANLQIYNLEKRKQDDDSFILIISIFAYGFIVVITLIGLTNIFNTITSNVELRQSEFASLKSIGMTKGEFNKMINLETIFYSSKALFIGIFIGMMGNLAIRETLGRRIEFTTKYYPVKPIFISVVAVFTLVFVIMRYSINKINKKNIIETIREENI